jgi:hypothetical protein
MEPTVDVHPWEGNDESEQYKDPEVKFVASSEAYAGPSYADRKTSNPTAEPTSHPMGSECLPKLDELCGDHKHHTAECPTCIHENKAELTAEKICEGTTGPQLVTAFCSTKLHTTTTTVTRDIAPTVVTSAATEANEDTATPTKERDTEVSWVKETGEVVMWLMLAIVGMVSAYTTHLFIARYRARGRHHTHDPLDSSHFPKAKAPPAMKRGFANTPAAGAANKATKEKVPLRADSPSRDEENRAPNFKIKEEKKHEAETDPSSTVLRVLGQHASDSNARSPLGNHTSNKRMPNTPLSPNARSPLGATNTSNNGAVNKSSPAPFAIFTPPVPSNSTDSTSGANVSAAVNDTSTVISDAGAAESTSSASAFAAFENTDVAAIVSETAAPAFAAFEDEHSNGNGSTSNGDVNGNTFI